VRAQWLAERQAELLPVPFFHVVFTLPASTILFRAAGETLATIAADPTHLQARHDSFPAAAPHPLGRLSPRLLPAGARALAAIPPTVLAGTGERLRRRQAASSAASTGWSPRSAAPSKSWSIITVSTTRRISMSCCQSRLIRAKRGTSRAATIETGAGNATCRRAAEIVVDRLRRQSNFTSLPVGFLAS
jgi:hypothetical protein